MLIIMPLSFKQDEILFNSLCNVLLRIYNIKYMLKNNGNSNDYDTYQQHWCL